MIGTAPTSAPSDVTPPAIDGTVQSGQTLSATTGSWSNAADLLRLPVAALRHHRGRVHGDRRGHPEHLCIDQC